MEAEALDSAWQEALGAEAERQATQQTRARAEPPGVTIRGAETELTSDLSTATASISPEMLLLQHGMDPAEWEILEARTNRWDAGAKSRGSDTFFHTTLHQMKVRVRPRTAPLWIVPASGTSEIVRPKPHVPLKGKTRVTLVTTDLQVPFHDPKLHELSLHLAETIRPDAWADLGDVLDLPMLSRYREKPEFKTTFQETINVGGKIFAERRQAIGLDATCDVLWGNHDTRLRNWMLEHARELFAVKRAQLGFEDDDQSVMDLDFLLRLDASGWRKARSPWGEYPYECIWIAPGLAGVHGEHVRKGGGNSVREELKERDHSVIQGHVNKLAAFTWTKTGAPIWRQSRLPGRYTIWGVEAGLMCLVDGSLGFAGQTTDWNRGLVIITTYDDGSFLPELAPYINGSLMYRGMRFFHDERGLVKVEV